MTTGLLHAKPGLHNVICDICGRKVRSDNIMKTWDGFIVCPEDYDPKQPQLTLKPRKEDTSVRVTRVRPEDKFVTSVDPDSLNQSNS